MKESYRIDIFDQTTGLVHRAGVVEIPGGSLIKVVDPLKKTSRIGRIKGKHLPDRD